MRVWFRSRRPGRGPRARAIRGKEATAPPRRRAPGRSPLSAGLRKRAAPSDAMPVAVGIARVTAVGSRGVEAEAVVVAAAGGVAAVGEQAGGEGVRAGGGGVARRGGG